jgi:hypothetical protein
MTSEFGIVSLAWRDRTMTSTCSTDIFKTCQGHAPPCNYGIKGHQYTKGYYLADGIYLTWVIFMKTISAPTSQKNCRFDER